MRISAPSSSVHSTRSGLSTTTSPTVWMSPAVTVPGPCFFTTMRLGPSPCILMAMSLMLRTMSVTSSRTPAIEENSCSTPSMCTDCTAAPCSEDKRMRRRALPSVTPKPRSSGSAITVASRAGSDPAVTWSLFGLINSCQFFWITSSPFQRRGHDGLAQTPPAVWGKISGSSGRAPRPRNATSHATTLPRPTTVVRNGGHVADGSNGETGRLQRAQRRLAARTRARHLDLERAHAVLLRLLGGILGRDLRSVRRRLARTLEAHGPSRRPGNGVALRVGDGDHGIVERRIHMRHARRDVLTFAPADAGGFLTHSQILSRPPACLQARAIRLSCGLLLAGDGLGRALAGARVGVRALATDRQTLAMAQAAVAAQVHQPLDVHRYFAAQVTLDHVVAVDQFTDLEHLGIGGLRHAPLLREAEISHDILGD